VVRGGYRLLGFDIDEARVSDLNAGVSTIGAVTSGELAELIATGRFDATSDLARLAECDAILICVPTPLTHDREPDLKFVVATARSIAGTLHPGQLVVLESTTYPGTTSGVVKPILEATGLKSGRDFFLGFSPEREDPGNRAYSTVSIPKIVAGDGDTARRLACALYGRIVREVVPVATTDVAEAAKLTENIFRAVNIALVNELKTIYGAMGVDVWEVIAAASTKPFGYMPFYPGPGLGGHCIPIDPFYLAWKARQHGLPARFIELAGEINVSMPRLIVERLAEELERRIGRSIAGASVLVLGLAYKKNVEDTRESPAFKLIELLEACGARVAFHDPLVPRVPRIREHPEFEGRASAPLTAETVAAADAVLIATDHDGVDYALVHAHARLIVDTRNVFGRLGMAGATVVKA
jgi:UDP-N-acetyl-D-glucosamine dehydrogenase